MTNRRDFLKKASFATASLWVPQFLQGFNRQHQLPQGEKIVVVLQLNGGNDGLNTVIPTRNDLYYRARPSIGIERQTALRLTDEAGLHPALPAFQGLFDDGSLAILNQVGYPNPDRSHFRSMDIWNTGSPADQVWDTGWLGRYLDAQCPDCTGSTAVIELDDTLGLALKGEKMKGLAFKEPKQLHDAVHSFYFGDYLEAHTRASGAAADADDSPIGYLYKTMAETISSADYIYEKSRFRPAPGNYPASAFGKDLRTIASLILAESNTRVYYVSAGSFDTHINQIGQQQRLFTEINAAVEVFVRDLKAANRWQDVMLLCFSEFGRRVEQNASGGTDHGAANCVFLAGGALKEKGLMNGLPDLSDLDQGDLRHTVDFRQVYATLLDRWLGVDSEAILKAKFDPLNFI